MNRLAARTPPVPGGCRLSSDFAQHLNAIRPTLMPMDTTPINLDLNKAEGLRIDWSDESESYYPIAYLRKMSPSAEARKLREDLKKNPLTVLPSSPKRGGGTDGPLTAISAELVGNYAIRIRFSDGHDTGIYSWSYLREIDPARTAPGASSVSKPD